MLPPSWAVGQAWEHGPWRTGRRAGWAPSRSGPGLPAARRGQSLSAGEVRGRTCCWRWAESLACGACGACGALASETNMGSDLGLEVGGV